MAAKAPTNAIFVGPEGELSVTQIKEIYTPRGGQSLVQVSYSAINPADLRHSYMGYHDSVAGYEWTGTVQGVGEDSPFPVGQELFGISMSEPRRPMSAGVHQDYLLAETYMTWALPAGMDAKVAVAMPIAMQTAADALFNTLGFGLKSANVDGDDAASTPILIWGGSSSVGFAAIQLAKAAGFAPIYTTASSRNHRSLEKLGADRCFDYRNPSIVEDIRNALTESGVKLTTVFDAVSAGLGVFEPPSKTEGLDFAQSTPSLARRCCSDVESDKLRLCGVLPVAHDPSWKFCLGTRPYGDMAFGAPQDPTFPGRVEKVMDWLFTEPAQFKSVPNLTVVQGAAEGIRQMNRVFDGKVSMEKVLIGRPL